MKKKMMVLVVIMTLLLSCTACGISISSSKGACKKLIGNVEKACNDKDLSALLDCMNPDKVTGIKLVVNTIKDSADKAMEYVLDSLGLSITAEGSADEAMKTIKIKPETYDLQDSEGTVTCKASFKAGETEIEKTLQFDVIKKDSSWYIDGVKLIED